MELEILKKKLSTLFYQSGYLTIKEIQDDGFLLGFPNEEVKLGFFKSLLKYLMPRGSGQQEFTTKSFLADLQNNDVDSLMNRIKSYLALFPYANKPKYEFYYRDIIYGLFILQGLYVQVETRSAKGRSDIMVKTIDTLYLFEFKYEEIDSTKALEKAWSQIDEKGYLIPYMVSNLKLIKVAAVFSKETQTLSSWKWEKI